MKTRIISSASLYLFLIGLFSPAVFGQAPFREALPPSREALRNALKAIPQYAPDRVLVAFKPGTPGEEKRALHRQMGGSVQKTLPAIGVDVVTVPAGTVLDKVNLYGKNPNVLYAEPDYNRLFVVPKEGNDTAVGDYFTQQWNLNNTGQDLYNPETGAYYKGIPDADIDAPEGWDITKGDSSIVIAVLDSGVDCDSVDFRSPDPNNSLLGKCVDQQRFTSVAPFSQFNPGVPINNPDYNDEIVHGTHVAAIAAANTNFSEPQGKGVAGIAPNVKIANLKVCHQYLLPLDPFGLQYALVGVCPVSASADAILYAANASGQQNTLNKPYDVINISYGSDCDINNDKDSFDSAEIDPSTGLPYPSTASLCGSEAEKAAIELAWGAGVVIVAAAGNDYGMDLHYPAAYPNVIAVTAVDHFDNLASFSTFGKDWVDMAAPGTHIFSAVPDWYCLYLDPSLSPILVAAEGCQAWFSGTSMASPHVAGVAAMVKSQSPFLSAAEVRAKVEGCADATGALGQNFQAWIAHGRVNLARSLSNDCDLAPPPSSLSVASLSPSSQNNGSTWTANVTVLVHDSGSPASGVVLVEAQWSTGASGNCTTVGGGTCSVSLSGLKKNVNSVTYTVNKLNGASATGQTTAIVNKP